ncbi:MAG TPA: UDP-3-O-(3-hydroxymyristoyl)glucosamine N-acyltransferase [Sulfuricurvum sp.]|nr:UDP-3-O-(3-hydroxymyristoyl)glucosamine N-acyltransferase [Sulfuricurvum sp.]
MLLSQVASALDLTYSGNDIDISGMNTLDDADSSQLSFITEERYLTSLQQTKAAAVLVTQALAPSVPASTRALVCDDPALSMAYASALFAPPYVDVDDPAPVIGEGSVVDPRANLENGVTVGKGCTIMAGAYLGSNVSVGDGTVVLPNATIYRDCVIGKQCRIHGGTTIGADGFGYSHTQTGEHVKIYQNGNVIIEDDVEIGSNCSVDRAVFASTCIRRGTKIDNNVHIGHNCDIGEDSILVAQVGVGGSTSLGRNCVVSGQTAFTDHLEIAPFSTFTARSGVTKSITESGKIWSGYPLMEHRQWARLQSRLAKLAKERTHRG